MLVAAGLPRGDAYSIVQRDALRAADEGIDFRDLLAADPEVTALLPPDALERCFDDGAWLAHVPTVMARLDALDGVPS